MLGQPWQVPTFGFFKINFILYLICVVWLIILFVAPAVEPEDSIHFRDSGLYDMVGEDEHFHDIEQINNPFGRIAYHSGDRMCHLKESRSFLVNGNQMPYCARCFGIFFGLALGAAITTFVRIELKWWLLIIGFVPIGLDGGLQYITTYESNNVLRLFTGTLIGIVTMIALGMVTVEISQSVKNWMIYKKISKHQSKEVCLKSKNRSKD